MTGGGFGGSAIVLVADRGRPGVTAAVQAFALAGVRRVFTVHPRRQGAHRLA